MTTAIVSGGSVLASWGITMVNTADSDDNLLLNFAVDDRNDSHWKENVATFANLEKI